MLMGASQFKKPEVVSNISDFLSKAWTKLCSVKILLFTCKFEIIKISESVKLGITKD